MTSKEFVRRCNAFASFDAAAGMFFSKCVSSVFRLVIIYRDGSKYETYVSTPSLLLSTESSDCYNSIWFDRFCRYEFDIQVKFFKSFLQKLSKYQLDIIHADNRFSNLFNYISNERKK